MKRIKETIKTIKDTWKEISPGKLADNANVFPKLNSLFPYRVFDETEGLYFNEGSYGFVLEATPLCGATQETVDILTGMITDGVPEGCTIQIIDIFRN